MSLSASIVTMPSAESLRRLAVSPSGFVFDPVTGNSFSVNETGHAILQTLCEAPSLPEVIAALVEQFDVEPLIAERDVMEFIGHLREQVK